MCLKIRNCGCVLSQRFKFTLILILIVPEFIYPTEEKIIIPMMKSKNGLKMVKSDNLNDKMIGKIVIEELSRFNNLIKGHKKILNAIGKL